MIRLALKTFADRWHLFAGTVLAVAVGVAIIHAGMTVILGVEGSEPPAGLSPADADAFRQSAQGASTLTGMTVMLAAFLTVFVVGSTIGFAVDQRRHDLAVLRLTGVTAGQVRRLLLSEAMTAGLLGAVAGAVLGFVFTLVQSRVLSLLGAFPDGLETPVQPAVLILDVAAAVVVSIVGAWGAARRATKVSALDGLRRSPEEQKVMTAGRWMAAVVAAVLTGVQVYFSMTVGGMLVPLLLGLGIVITASVMMSRLAPLLVPALAGCLHPWAFRSPVVAVAVANLRDAVRRTASCAAPMIVLVSLVMGLQGILDTQTKAAANEATQLLSADFVAEGDDVDVDAVRQVSGVESAAPETTVPLSLRLSRGGVATDGPGTVVAVDPDAFRTTHLQKPASGDLASFGPGSVVLGPGLDSLEIRGTYDRISLSVGDEVVELTQAARMAETLGGEDGFYIDRSILPAEVLDRHTRVLVTLASGADEERVRHELALAGAPDIRTLSELSAGQSDEAEKENRAVMGAIVGLGSVYALISVLSTLAMSVSQRRSEFAVLRLGGMTRRQIVRAVVVESIASTTIGLVLGAVAAVLALTGLWGATAQVYGSPVFAVPWVLLVGLAVLTGALTALTAVVMTSKAVGGSAVENLGVAE